MGLHLLKPDAQWACEIIVSMLLYGTLGGNGETSYTATFVSHRVHDSCIPIEHALEIIIYCSSVPVCSINQWSVYKFECNAFDENPVFILCLDYILCRQYSKCDSQGCC